MEYHSGGSLPLLGRPRYCPGAKANGGYLCETGHCCGESGCCTYYYELWWFWLLWTVLILFSCCCAYRHRRAKLRVQQQQRQREISLLAYHGANSFPSSMLDLSFLASLKLPSYEEVAAQPSTPPPPYSSVFTTPRYPQPPRASDPHLLTQHGPLLHRRLSDGPSSFSSDNSSSSCSCDSCCPSSPCSSSISAPVTYETDTSHATTPGEAAPLTLEVTMETIAAAATCLEVNKTQFVCERMAATAAIDISDEDAAGAQEPFTTDSLAPKQTVLVSPHPLPSPSSEVDLTAVSTSPINQLDPATSIPTVSTCSPSTLCSPIVVETKLPSIQIMGIEDSADGSRITPAPKITSISGPFTSAVGDSDSPTATQALDLTRTCNTDNVPQTPPSVPSPDVGRTLVLLTGSDLQTPDLNPILVPIPVPANLTQASIPELTDLAQASIPELTDLAQASIPELTDLAQASIPELTDLAQASIPELTDLAQASIPELTDLAQASILVITNLTEATDVISTNIVLDPELVRTNNTPFPDTLLKNLTQAPDPVPSNLSIVPNPHPKSTTVPDCAQKAVVTPKPAHSNLTLATDLAPNLPTLTHCQSPELSPGSVLVLGPTRTKSGMPQHPGGDAVLAYCLDPAIVPADSGPSLVLSHLSESDLISPLPPNVQAAFSSGSEAGSSKVGSRSGPLSAPAPVLSYPTPVLSSLSSSCPAITIECETSFALSQSPLAALSPSSPPPLPSPPSLASPPALSSILLPAPALLLDPLTVPLQSNKGGSSSGHASSLSPSPRATQSPPKQTLFSPCVDVFEPRPPSWEDEEEEQEEEDNEDDDDEDMGADESQYRHRRLTGDSGIEVCRCRVEEEEEEEEEEEKGEKKDDGGEGAGGERDKKGVRNPDLHDSVDCPARSEITTGEGVPLCDSTSTPTYEEGVKIVIVMETV